MRRRCRRSAFGCHPAQEGGGSVIVKLPWRGVLALVGALGVAGGCGKPNHAPVIVELRVSSTYVEPGGNTTLAADVMDEDGDAVDYDWNANGGALLNLAPDSVRWLAPHDTNTYRVTLIVSDARGAADTASTNIGVGPTLH